MKPGTRTRRWAAAAGALGACAVLLAAAPAGATTYPRTSTAPHGTGRAYASADGHHAKVCDWKSDGHTVWGTYYFKGGIYHTSYSFKDGNGAKRGCSTRTFKKKIIHFIACYDVKTSEDSPSKCGRVEDI